jgi:hypothetical protein
MDQSRDIFDVLTLADFIIGYDNNELTEIQISAGDLDDNGLLDMSDLNLLISIIMETIE